MPSSGQNKLILACDIGATNFRLALFDQGNIVESLKVPTPTVDFLDSLKKEMKDFLSGRSVQALGLSVAGRVRQEEKFVRFPNVVGKPEIFENDFTELAPRVVMLNDALSAVYAEYFKEPKSNLIYITISTGIGAGVISNNKPFYFDEKIRELGHREVEGEFDFNCGCGGKNHWEAFCSGKNLVRFYIEWSRKNGYTPEEFKGAKEIFLAADTGSESAKRFLDEGFGEINRKGLEMVIEEFAPEKIVFGGSVAYNNQEEIRLELEGRVPELPEISFTEFGDDISLIGISRFVDSKLGRQ